MSRLDDLSEELSGMKAKTSKPSAIPTFNVQSNVKINHAQSTPSTQIRDFGTKKDPSKLRPSVLPSTESEDIIERLLQKPVETEKSSPTKKIQAEKVSSSTSSELHDSAKFATGSGFNKSKFTKRLNRYVVEKRMTHLSKDDIGTFSNIVAKHARAVSSGSTLGRSARTSIKKDITNQWKQGAMSRTSAQSLKGMLGDL